MCKQTDSQAFHKQLETLIDPNFWSWSIQAVPTHLSQVLDRMVCTDDNDVLMAQAEIDVDLLILDWQSDIGKDYF